MKFELRDAAWYRSATLEDLNTRYAEIGKELVNPESEFSFEELKAEAERCKEALDRQNRAAEIARETRSFVAAGAGQVIERSNPIHTEATVVDQFDTPEYRNAFMEYVCRGKQFPVELRTATTITPAGTVTTDVPIQIPTTMGNQIISEMSTRGKIWAKVTKLNVQGGLWFRVLDLKPIATWIGEKQVSNYQKVESNEKITFSYHTLECRMAQTLLASIVTFEDFQRLFVPAIADAMVDALEQAIIRGSGEGQFLGIVNDPRVTNVVEMTAEEFGNWKAWRKKVKAAMPISYRSGEFIMAQSSFDSYIETMSDDTNAPVSINYNPVTGEEEYRLMGFAVDTVEPVILPDFDKANNGAVVAIYGRMGDYAVNSQMQVATVKWIDHETNEEKTKAMLVADGKVLDKHGFILIKKKASA